MDIPHVERETTRLGVGKDRDKDSYFLGVVVGNDRETKTVARISWEDALCGSYICLSRSTNAKLGTPYTRQVTPS